MRQGVRGIFILLAVTAILAADKVTLLQPGASAPSFSLPNLEGTRSALREFCGDTLLKPYLNKTRYTIILSFWATYCRPCQQEIPELQKFMEKHTADSVKLFCISLDAEGAQVVRPFVEKKRYAVPVLIDQYKTAAVRYGVKALPALFVIDDRAVIRFSSTGYDRATPLDQKLESIIALVKARKPVPLTAGPAEVETTAVKTDDSKPPRQPKTPAPAQN